MAHQRGEADAGIGVMGQFYCAERLRDDTLRRWTAAPPPLGILNLRLEAQPTAAIYWTVNLERR